MKKQLVCFDEGEHVMVRKVLQPDGNKSQSPLIAQLDVVGRYEVEWCEGGLTKLVNIDKPVPTIELTDYPENSDALLFAIKTIDEQLVTVVEAAGLLGGTQVSFRSSLNKLADFQLPNPLIIEIGGKQFVRRALVDKMIFTKKNRKQIQADARQLKIEDMKANKAFDDGLYDEFAVMNLSELRAYAKTREGFAHSHYTRKSELIAALRKHRQDRSDEE